MKENKDVKTKVIMIVMAVLIALCLVICIFCLMSNKVQKLNPMARETVQSTMSVAEYAVKEIAVSYSGAVFSCDTDSAEVETDEDELSGDYICSYSSDRELTSSDVVELINSCEETLPEGKSVVQMVINELYAKYGYEFSTESITEYFETKTWYASAGDRNPDMDMIYNSMTDVEKANIEFLQSY